MLPDLDPVNRFKMEINLVQSALKSWSAGLSTLIRNQRDVCLFWIDWLDKAEEGRNLTALECLLRPLLKERYEELAVQEEIKWRQHSRVQWLKAGDSNTKFFHRHANCRQSVNHVSSLSDGNTTLSTHDDLAKYLFSFFGNHLGVAPPARSTINFQILYGDASPSFLSPLLVPITADEVKNAVFASAAEKAPGPDGFSMSFYQRFWDILKDDILEVFEGFYAGAINLSPVNTSWICPIPKKTELRTARDLRPISLVHNISKLISKVLATRVQGFLHLLINPHQTAFIKGRHILDNFFCAHFLVHHLHSSKTPAAALKIDFERAFNYVNWTFLKDLLEARGFGDSWLYWIDSLLHSASAAVLLNGVPGKTFNYERGLRQGDPLSPLLFILCIDVLFRMLQMATNAKLLPAVGMGECCFHTLQFADDLLIVFDGTLRSAAVIRLILDAFSESSGLKINFGKSAILPLNLTVEQTDSLATFFNCTSLSFPLMYLGFPLSPKK